MEQFQCMVVVLFVASIIDWSSACSCLTTHPQTLFCHADFVIMARLRGEKQIIYRKTEVNTFVEETNETESVIERYPLRVQYNVKIKKIFKIKDNDLGLNENSSVAQIHTGPNDGLCGVHLEKRTKYLLAGYFEGGQLTINLCGWVTPWPWVTKSQRKGLRSLYEKNCDCEPVNVLSHYDEPPTSGNFCKWHPYGKFSQCYNRWTACVHDQNSSTGGCKWQRNPKLKECKIKTKSRGWEP